MSNLHITLVFEPGPRCASGHALAAPGLWLTAGATPPPAPSGARVISTRATALQPVVRELQPLLTDAAHAAQGVARPAPLAVGAEPSLLRAVARLAELNPEAMLRFALAYCLVNDGARCSALLRYLVAPDFALFDFIHQHRLEPWPVARYAEALGLPLRKFNQLFKDKYDMSAKQWLQTQRLEHACELLRSTSKKIIEVALESGFCTPAHFSERFRLHFQQSPRDVRQQARRAPAAVHPSQESPMAVAVNLQELNGILGDGISKAEAGVRLAMTKDLTNNPTDLLGAQYALTQYSTLIGLGSSLNKEWKDMLQTITRNV